MRTLLIAIVLVTSRLAAEEPKKPAPPDREAYSEAQKIFDPRKKIDALRKFTEDYPKSTSANYANVGRPDCDRDLAGRAGAPRQACRNC